MVVRSTELLSAPTLELDTLSFGTRMQAELLRARLPGFYLPGLPYIADWRIGGRRDAVGLEALQESGRLLEKVLTHPAERVLQLMAMHLQACQAYEQYDFPRCLVTAWPMIEALLQRCGRRYAPDELTKKRDYTAASLIKILSLMKALPAELCADLGSVRVARNGWMHEMGPVTRELAE